MKLEIRNQLTEHINQVRSRLIFSLTFIPTYFFFHLLLVSTRNASLSHFHIGFIFLNLRLLPSYNMEVSCYNVKNISGVKYDSVGGICQYRWFDFICPSYSLQGAISSRGKLLQSCLNHPEFFSCYHKPSRLVSSDLKKKVLLIRFENDPQNVELRVICKFSL